MTTDKTDAQVAQDDHNFKVLQQAIPGMTVLRIQDMKPEQRERFDAMVAALNERKERSEPADQTA
jgi:hypothetical protein